MTRFACIAAVVALGSAVAGNNAQAASFHHIDSLALRLQQQANLLVHELHEHYRHSSSFRRLDRDAHEMARLAGHIHELVHHGRNLNHIRDDIDQLDHQFHHIQSVARRMAFRYDMCHIRQVLASMSDTLHHLQEDIEELAARGHRSHRRYDRGYGHGFGHGRHVAPGRSIRFGNSQFGIRFGW